MICLLSDIDAGGEKLSVPIGFKYNCGLFKTAHVCSPNSSISAQALRSLEALVLILMGSSLKQI